MPQSIAAFVYFDDETALQAGQGQDLRLPDKIVAVTNYVKLLDYYKLSERDLPLLKVNRSELTFEDVSFGARKFLANHSYETYRRQNPYRKANPPASVVTDENETAVAVDGALPRAWPSPSPSPAQAGQEQQLAHDHQADQAQERKAEVIGTNERVVSGELLRCRKPMSYPNPYPNPNLNPNPNPDPNPTPNPNPNPNPNPDPNQVPEAHLRADHLERPALL